MSEQQQQRSDEQVQARASWRTLYDFARGAAILSSARGVFVRDGQGGEDFRSYPQLLEDALRVACALERRGVSAGERVLVMMSTGYGFWASFVGASLIGAIPTPLAPPRRDHPDPLRAIASLNRLARRLDITTAIILSSLPAEQRPTLGGASPWQRVLTLESLREDAPLGAAPTRIHASPIAYLQPTAGATGPLRGVCISHDNLRATCLAVGQTLQITPEDIGLCWLPLDNVMGLVGFMILSMFWGLDLVLIDPERFLARPQDWLWAIDQHRATITAAPDFAYYHCVRRVNERDLQRLDLSSLRVAMSGAEPVRARHLKLFARRFKPYGLAEHVFLPVYGLSEATLGVTFSSPGKPARVDAINRRRLEHQGVADLLPASGAPTPAERMHLVSVGRPLPGVTVAVLDAAGQPLPDRTLGEIAAKGPNLMVGYAQEHAQDRPHAHGARMDGDWLRTGDLGYLVDGDLFFVERLDDLIVTPQGRRIFPGEVELFVNAVDGVRAGSAVVFASSSRAGARQLIVAYEGLAGATPEACEAELLRQLEHHLALRPDVVLRLSPFSVPRTRDGKVCRRLAQQLYEEERLDRRARTTELDGVLRLANRARGDVLRLTQSVREWIGRLNARSR